MNELEYNTGSKVPSANLPAAVLLCLTMATSWLAGTSGSPTIPDYYRQRDSLTKSQEVEDRNLPAYKGVVSFPTRIWDDPFRHRASAFEAFEKMKTLDDAPYFSSVVQDSLKGEKSLMIMPVIVRGDAQGTGASDRVHYRHAVENALAIQGFTMDLPNRMSFCELKKLRVNLGGSDATDISHALPLKLYSSESNPNKKILVVWVDRRWLGTTPMDLVLQICKELIDPGLDSKPDTAMNRIAKYSKNLRISIIGPNYSGDLEKFSSDDSFSSDEFLPGQITVFSPSATDYDYEADKPKQDLADKGIELVRTIGNNDSLVKCLANELRCRWLLGSRTVVFAEQGYQSPQSLQKQFCDLEEYQRTDKRNLVVVPFLKGIRSNGHANIEASDVEDYFTRTVANLSSNQILEREEVRLVGVFANETADKLAIFNAARQVFPNAAFFTIDLHADFLSRVNMSATRNLIVASHWGLSVPDELMQNISQKAGVTLAAQNREPLKFRDSYQTSVCFAANLALHRFTSDTSQIKFACGGANCTNGLLDSELWCTSGGDDDHRFHPAVFEIGFSGEYAYEQLIHKHSTAHRQTNHQINSSAHWVQFVTWKILPLLAVSIVLVFVVSIKLQLLLSRWVFGVKTCWQQISFKRNRGEASLNVAGPPEINLKEYPSIFFAFASDVLKKSSAARHTKLFAPELVFSAILTTVFYYLHNQTEIYSIYYLVGLLLVFLGMTWSFWRTQKRDRFVFFTMLLVYVCFVVGGILLWLSQVDSNTKTYTAAVEPLSILQGISVWPSVIVFVLVVVFSMKFLARHLETFSWWIGIRPLEKVVEHLALTSDIELKNLPASKILYRAYARDLRLPLDDDEIDSLSPLSRIKTNPLALARCTTYLTIAAAIVMSWSNFFVAPPARGNLGLATAFFAATLASLLVFLVVSNIGIETLALRRVLRLLNEIVADRPVTRMPAAEVYQMLAKWIEQVTCLNSRRFWVPALLILAYSVARLPLFDGWQVNWTVLTLILLPFGCIIFVAFLARLQANTLRQTIVMQLESAEFRGYYDQDETNPIDSAVIAKAKAQICGLDQGAFGSIWQDPILGTVLLFCTTILTGPGREVAKFVGSILSSG